MTRKLLFPLPPVKNQHNPEQLETIKHVDGPILVAAVAGSGKTRALVHRIAYLVKKQIAQAATILALTFSKKAADEMNTRLNKLLGPTEARVGTFHSLAWQILREEKDYINQGWRIDGKDKYRICIKDAVGYQHMNWKRADVTLITDYISKCKNGMARPTSKKALDIASNYQEPQMMLQAYKTTEKLRKQRRLVTFDDMILEVAELLLDNENTRSHWASKWNYVLQDEAQDQNLCQMIIGEKLAQDHKNYMIIGDPSQTIYTWRGAMPEKLLNFEKTWNAKVIKMNRNYRCGSQIIDIANKSLINMKEETRLDMEMVAEKGIDGAAKVEEYHDLDDEATSVTSHIQTLLEDGYMPKDISILYRINAQSRAPEEQLISTKIPYRIIGGTNFYERKEVKDLLAYLRLASHKGSIKDISRCINSPFRYLSTAFVQKVEHYYDSPDKPAYLDPPNTARLEDLMDAVEQVIRETGIQRRQIQSAEQWTQLISQIANDINNKRSPSEILEYIVQQTEYTEWLTKNEGEETTENNRVSNVRELIRAASRFPTTEELLDYIDDMTKASHTSHDDQDPNKVTLCTIHRAKGLEWKAVNLIGVNDNILPHARTQDMEEERRLFYVGVTRAMENLHISYVQEASISNKVIQLEPSQFLYETDLIEQEENTEEQESTEETTEEKNTENNTEITKEENNTEPTTKPKLNLIMVQDNRNPRARVRTISNDLITVMANMILDKSIAASAPVTHLDHCRTGKENATITDHIAITAIPTGQVFVWTARGNMPKKGLSIEQQQAHVASIVWPQQTKDEE